MRFEDIYKNDIFANEAGVVLEELNDDASRMTLKVTPAHLNAGNSAHGGAIFLLTDIAMAAIANHKQYLSVSIQSDIRFLAAAREGDTLTAVATMVFGRKSLCNCRCTVENQRGELVAIAEGMFHTKRV